MLKKFADTLAGYKSGILACYDYRISSGPLEGTNNKIKTMKRMHAASGIWNSSNSKLWQISYSSFMLSQGYSQLDGSSPLDDSDQDDDNSNDQQDMNKVTHRIATHHPQQPQNYQYNGDRPQHMISLPDR